MKGGNGEQYLNVERRRMIGCLARFKSAAASERKKCSEVKWKLWDHRGALHVLTYSTHIL